MSDKAKRCIARIREDISTTPAGPWCAKELPRVVEALEVAVEALRQVEANTRMKGRLAVNAYVQDALARIDRLLNGETEKPR